LSRFAQDGDAEEFGITAVGHSVVGLQNRRQLKRTDSVAPGARSVAKSYGWGERNWMDKQRQFLQAYEYLCHIGEAKEWIEDIISKPIPAIVHLEEGLRDGVTLAEIVQAFHPDQTLKIFRNPKLQYKHSDNIVMFFRFLEDVGLPDLFRFELIDLYEKKNIPKVIYCIHALSWLLYRKGMVDFRIGNLVGQLEFEHHELEQTQRGLDKAGISMPSFSGMGASFGAEPEPEPVETEDERLERELHEQEATILELQNQVRGALVRIQLGDMMQQLWDSEDIIIDLQARIRGDWARQISAYRLDMHRFATNLQSSARGFIFRSSQQRKEQIWKSREKDILKLQSMFRAGKARAETRMLKSNARRHDAGIRNLQAAIRGALSRRDAFDQYEATRTAEREVLHLQANIRGMLARKQIDRDHAILERQSTAIARIQAGARSTLVRIAQAKLQKSLLQFTPRWTALQAVIRASHVREEIGRVKKELRSHSASLSKLQAALRGANAREACSSLKLSLLRQSTATIPLQAAVRGFTLRHGLQKQRALLERHAPRMVQLQAFCRGGMLRMRTADILNELDDAQPEVLQLQALIRAMLCRARVADLLGELETHEEAITGLQALMRAAAIRSQFAEKKRYFKENMEKVVKIQSVVRAKIQGKAYKSLTVGKNPPVGTLKGFVHLLNDSDFDFDEEIEFERLRKTVVQHVRQNELADQYITQLDIKIALLVKNKITLDEVVKHQRHFGGHVGALLPNSDMASKDPFDLKALNKTSRRKLEHYQELFFMLQTQPQYLSRLFRRIREQATAEKECDRVKHLVMGLFGYAQKRREEYYLVKLIVRSIKEEADCSLSLQDYLRTNSFSNKLFGAYSKSPRDRKFLRDVLGPLVKENIIDNDVLDLESDPLQIYRSAINNEELRTGRRSQRDPNVPREVAIRDPETRGTFISHMQDLRDITDQFFLCLEDCIHRMPFGVRFVVQQTYEHLLARFPGEEADFVLQLVGQWLWRSYLQPALLEPEKFGVADRAMTQEQKRNLGEVSKVLNQAASGREFGGDNVYLQPLNNYIRESIDRFAVIWSHGTWLSLLPLHDIC
jgi:Ras GTPase-activating-like protein IQGAP2/3